MTSEAVPLRAARTTTTWEWKRYQTDLVGVGVVVAVTAVAAWRLVYGGTVVGLDSAAFFYPMYAFLGRQLAAGHLPRWNPYQFSGAPFAGDPESGWMYLPAMLLFAALPLTAAAKAFIVFHLMAAGLGAYALGRVLRLSLVGSLLASVAYELNGFYYDRSACCPVHVEVGAWLPLLLIATELAIRSRSWLARGGWWGAAGLCLSQPLAAWLGQGAYYVLLALGGYVAYRTLLDPPPFARSVRARLGGLALHGGAIVGLGVALAAAGILPRLEYNARSNLADGYTGHLAWAATIGGLKNRQLAAYLLGRTGWYVGGATIALALMALLVVRRRHVAPYFAVLSLGALVLAMARTTPLHEVLYRVLPRFQQLHQHWPERAVVILYLGPALLAGAAVTALADWSGTARDRRWRVLLVVAAASVPILALLVIRDHHAPVSRLAEEALLAASGLVVIQALVPWRPVRRLVPVLLLVLVGGDLLAAARYHLDHERLVKVDLDAYYDPGGAGRYLLQLQDRGSQPFRYLGYNPQLAQPDWDREPALYRYAFDSPRATKLIVNNRATLLGLQDIQGYNPIQDQRYVDYMAALNGHAQEYHGSYVFPAGLGSPLLDLLNVRYVVVPATVPADRPDLRRLSHDYPSVYQDNQVKVLENPKALPRAWLVHAARQVPPAEALKLLAARAVDPRQTALVEDPPPPLVRSRDPAADEASVTAYDPDRIRLTTHSDAPAILMLSEVAYPGWHAYVDGKPVNAYRADDVLRGVPVPAGTHRVELRYESAALRVGLAISLIAYGGLIVLVGALALARATARQRPGALAPGPTRAGSGAARRR